jgi:hypothetical protein
MILVGVADRPRGRLGRSSAMIRTCAKSPVSRLLGSLDFFDLPVHTFCTRDLLNIQENGTFAPP